MSSPFNYEGIYSQAYALYRQGFRYWFDKNEILQLAQHNKQFETANLEMELIAQYFRVPNGNELSSVKLGRAFKDMGFQFHKSHGIRGYIAVRRSAEEMRSMRYQMAQGADGADGAEIF